MTCPDLGRRSIRHPFIRSPCSRYHARVATLLALDGQRNALDITTALDLNIVDTTCDSFWTERGECALEALAAIGKPLAEWSGPDQPDNI